MFLGLPDPDPDPLLISTDPDLDPGTDPSIDKQKSNKNLDYFVTFLLFFYENCCKFVFKINAKKTLKIFFCWHLVSR
jgi:hypothetical protein